MNDVVQPESVDPLVLQDDVRFSNLVVDIVQGMDTLYHVMYISTGQSRKRWCGVKRGRLQRGLLTLILLSLS